MDALHTSTLYINPAHLSISEMEAPHRMTTILQILQINDQGRFSSGKKPSEIAQELSPALMSLSDSERQELTTILPRLPIVYETRIHIEGILKQ